MRAARILPRAHALAPARVGPIARESPQHERAFGFLAARERAAIDEKLNEIARDANVLRAIAAGIADVRSLYVRYLVNDDGPGKIVSLDQFRKK